MVRLYTQTGTNSLKQVFQFFFIFFNYPNELISLYFNGCFGEKGLLQAVSGLL